jgi:subtilase family serine protease
VPYGEPPLWAMIPAAAANADFDGAGGSTTRYYLSSDATKGAGDVLLAGTRTIAAVRSGASATGSRTVTVPTATALGTYYLLACADDLVKVAELDETNNCLASSWTIAINP